ncbi:winged helix-turn-helix domain-containing protein [Pedobacter sp. PWIIR3]
MQPIQLSKTDARKIILHAAGLSKEAQFGTGIEAVYRFIDHLGFVQLDTNYVVERAHHQVIWSRVPDYEQEWLKDLQEEGRIFEFFTSDSGFIPMHDFRFSLPVKDSFEKNRKELTPAEKNLMKQILDRIEREGPLMVGDFDNDRIEASSGWWDWRPAKVALERLYLNGQLMITRDQKFHKIYDQPLNLVPADTDLTLPSAEEYARFVVIRTLGALGIAYVKDIAWRARYVKGNLVKQELGKMVAEGSVINVQVEGFKGPLYMLEDQKTAIEISNEAFILSPFDILNVFRHRLRDFFDFDYQVECFVPAPKRKYGYFSHPVLVGDKFVARLDAKADRKNKKLIVNNLHFEEVELTYESLIKITEKLKAFVLFNGCMDVELVKSNREDYLLAIKSCL